MTKFGKRILPKLRAIRKMVRGKRERLRKRKGSRVFEATMLGL
jgi:hypothetical protein